VAGEHQRHLGQHRRRGYPRSHVQDHTTDLAAAFVAQQRQPSLKLTKASVAANTLFIAAVRPS
jgi:hypothetical protein